MLSSEFVSRLACPRDHSSLVERDGQLHCDQGHAYPIIHGVPVMLVDEADHTLWVAKRSLEKSASGEDDDLYHIDTLGITDEERAQLVQLMQNPGEVDPVVSFMVGATSGNLYKGIIGKLQSYPIPEFRLPAGKGLLLDIGCNWGRWCMAAGRKGYRVTGIDPSLGAVLAAKRVTTQLGIPADFVVGDGRYLPFKTGAFDVTFSYSVLQHLSYENATAAIAEAGRVLKPGGKCMIQLPNVIGLRNLQFQIKRGFRAATDFDVRYWSPARIRRVFTKHVGKTRITVDGFFGLGIQAADISLLPPHYRLIVRSSEFLRAVSKVFPPLLLVADSLYAEAVRQPSNDSGS